MRMDRLDGYDCRDLAIQPCICVCRLAAGRGGGVRGRLLGLGVFSVLGWGICVVFGWRCAISMVGLCYVGSTVGSAVFASVSILKIAEWSLTPMWITDAC